MKYLFFTLTISLLSFSTFAANYPAKKTTIKPVIDGNANDECWTNAVWAPIDQLWVGSAANATNYTGRFKASWDDSLVYILVEIKDDVFHDTHSNPLDNYWNDDCIEIFVDEDKSGGDHLNNFNAFAYHVSPFGDVVDNDKTKAALFNHHLMIDVDTVGTTYLWEVKMRIYNDKYDQNNPNNNRVTLNASKVLGFSMAYNDSDNQNTRERMYGSQVITATDKNISYKTADAFGTMTLEMAPLSIEEMNTSNSNSTYYNQENKLLNLDQTTHYESIIVYNLEGKEIKKYTLLDNVSSLGFESVEKGMYLVKLIENSKRTSTLKIIGN